MQSLAASPGTDMEPTWLTREATGPSAFRIRLARAVNWSGQRWS
jgi:hypothetical protein